MRPAFEEAAVQMRSQASPTQLVEVDCMEERTLCSRFGVAAFPQMRLIRRDEPSDPALPLRVFHFSMQRTTLSFLVFCSTVWRTMLDAAMPYPEPAPQEAQRLREAWDAQLQLQAQRALPAAAGAMLRGASSDAPADAAQGDDLLGTLKRLSSGGVRELQQPPLPLRAVVAGSQGVASGEAGAAADSEERPSRLPFILGFFFLLFLAGGLLLRYHWASLRMRVTRHHSLQLSKNY